LTKRSLALFLFVAGTALATPFQYSFSAPAITTGPVQAEAFSFSFTSLTLYTGTTPVDVTSLFGSPTSFDPANPDFFSATLFPADPSVGDFSIDYGVSGSDSVRGSIVGSQPFDTTGVFSVNWQILDFGQDIAGDSVEGTLTITDLGAQGSVPEPSSVVFVSTGLGLAAVLLRRRKRSLRS
jgi:hypothetical protein